jgi:biotin operon repressor
MEPRPPQNDDLVRLLRIFETADEPMTAAAIAAKLGLDGSVETQRRAVRAMVKGLRDHGHWIVATLTDGYALTKNAGIWRDYSEGRAVDARRIFWEVSDRKKQMSDGNQGLLFSLAGAMR